MGVAQPWKGWATLGAAGWIGYRGNDIPGGGIPGGGWGGCLSVWAWLGVAAAFLDFDPRNMLRSTRLGGRSAEKAQ